MTTKTKSTKFYLLQGIILSMITYALTEFMKPLYLNEEIEVKRALIAFPIWIIAGLLFAYVNKWLANRKSK